MEHVRHLTAEQQATFNQGAFDLVAANPAGRLSNVNIESHGDEDHAIVVITAVVPRDEAIALIEKVWDL